MFRLIGLMFFTGLLFGAPSLEVVLTTPVETELSVPGTRDTKETWIAMFQGAKERIDIEQFYISDQKGEALEPVLKALKEASSRGVKIRIIADKKFFATYPESVKELGGLLNAESRIIDFASTNGVQHSKYFVVDGRESYVGSANFDWRALSHIHELGLRVIDADFSAALGKVFEMDWAKAEPLRRDAPSDTSPNVGWGVTPFLADAGLVVSPTSLVPSGLKPTLDTIIDMIEGAKSTIRVQVYEYSTKVFGETGKKWLDLDEALKRAARRGVSVDLMVDATKVASAKSELASLAKQKNIAVKGVAIPEASSGPIPYARLIHSKYMIVDGGRSWVGTDNWSKGYFLNSRGVGVVSENEKLAGQLDGVFQSLWTSRYAASVN